jgi:hypothetical protein
MYKVKLFACLVIITFVGLSCAIPGQTVATMAVIPPAPAQAGIDMPKEGDIIPLASYEIVYHGADFTEVKQLELAINSVPVTIQANPSPGTGFVLMRYIWTPASTGTYIIQTRAQNQNGEWGPYSYITVTVTAPIDQAQPTPENTMEPTVSVIDTAIPTQMLPTVNLAGDGIFTSIVKSEDWIYYGNSRCGSSEVSFSVTIFNFTGIHYVFAFVRLHDKYTSDMTDWNSGKPMKATSSGTYVVTITLSDLTKYGDFSEAWIWYQFVVQKPDGQYVRSKVYTDVSLSKCQ